MIEVSRQSECGLKIELWRFSNASKYFGDDIRFVVEFYGIGTKKTKRHKPEFSEENRYKRIDNRYHDLDVKYVPLPQDVIDEVVSKISIKVGFWNDI